MGENVLLLRFNDHHSDPLVRPADDAERLANLDKVGASMPPIVEAELGFGRAFASSRGDGLAAVDLDPGATLLARSASIQVALAWDIEATAAAGGIATIYARGKGTDPAEYVSAGLELRVIDAASRIGEVRWLWQTIAGDLKRQIGGHFHLPTTGEIILTATRRWSSSSRVVLRYYIGDALLAEVESADGEIGGGTTATTSIGVRYSATAGAWSRHFDGVLDELRVVDDELAEEEVRATWSRITVEQPRGYRLLLEAHDPGFPMSPDPRSRVQRETRMWGHALGYAAAQAENVRDNLLPDRAYGEVLRRWESITKQAPHAGDDVSTRRRRVVGKIRQRLGASVAGVRGALAELLDTVPEALEVIAFNNTIADDWATLNALRWRHDPAIAASIVAGALRHTSASDRLAWSSWITSLAAVQGDGRGASMIAKVTPTTIGDGGETGLVFIDRAARNAFLFGVRNNGGAYQLVTSSMLGGALGAASVQAPLGGLGPLWLGLSHREATGNMTAAWSAAPLDGAPFPDWNDGIGAGFSTFQWAGFYTRTFKSSTPAIVAAFDDSMIRAPYGDRPFRFYVVRDASAPGDPDYLGANATLRGLRQAHTIGAAVRAITVLYDDTLTGHDSEPMGGI